MKFVFISSVLLSVLGCSNLNSIHFPFIQKPSIESEETIIHNLAYPGFSPGDTLWALQLTTNPLPSSIPASTGITWQRDLPDGQPSIQFINNSPGNWPKNIPLDFSLFRGMRVIIKYSIKLENVVSDSGTTGSMTVGFRGHSASVGDFYPSQSNLKGTMNWTSIQTSESNIPVDTDNLNLQIGLSLCTGKAWLRDIQVIIIKPAVHWPTITDSNPVTRNHTPLRGIMLRDTRFLSDIDTLASWNANMFNWQIQGNAITASTSDSDYQAWLNKLFGDLDSVLNKAKQNKMKVIVVMQSPIGGRAPDNAMLLFSDSLLQKRYLDLWRAFSSRYAHKTNAIAAYDLLSEPVQTGLTPPHLLDWRSLQTAAARIIRSYDNETEIIIQVDGYDNAEEFAMMTPINLPHLTYGVHMYAPHEFTHQGIYKDWGTADGDPIVTYPGTFEVKKGTTTQTITLNKDYLIKHLKIVRDFQLSYRVPIYVGEFSAARWATGADTYLTDVTGLFEEYGWDWSYYTYSEAPVWDLWMADSPYGHGLRPIATTPTNRFLSIQNKFSLNLSPY